MLFTGRVRLLICTIGALWALVPAPPASAALPGAVAALGDSLSVAYGAGGAGHDYPAASWATGSEPGVDSLYVRLLADGATGARAFDDATSGTKIAATTAQAQTAVSQGAQYVTLWSGTNDVCTGTIAQMTSVSSYAASIRQTLTTLVNGTPGVRILAVSIPNLAALWQNFHGDATAANAWALYPGRCPDLLSTTATTTDRQAFAQRVADLNAAIQSACASFAQCTYDGGAAYALWSTLGRADLTFDYFHLSVTGQAKVAAALWASTPFAGAVQTALGYPAAGGTSAADGAGYLDVSGPWTLSGTAATSQLRGWLGATSASGTLRAILYADDGGNPGSVVATSNEVTLPAGQPAGWVTFPLPATASLAPGSYWLGYWYADGRLSIGFDSGIASQRYRTAAYAATGGAPSSFGSASTGTHDYSLYAVLSAGTPVAPVNTAVPAIAGTAEQGQTLTGSPGSWTGNPTGYTYQWRRCDTTGTTCTDITAAAAQTYTLTAADIGTTIRLAVTATNSAGSTTATSAQTASVAAAASSVPSGFTSVVVDGGCGGCSVVAIDNGLRATIQGGNDALDTAYALDDFGGAAGLAGRTYTRDLIGLDPGQTLTANLAVFHVHDVTGGLVYELYITPGRMLNLWSPAGGLQASSTNVSTGVVVPNDGTTLQVEVSALASSSLIVRVDGVDVVTLTGLTGATTGNQRYLRAGIDHYDATTTNETVSVAHTDVAITQTGWLGAPGSSGSPTATAPTNTAPPTITGTAQQGQTLTGNPGSWTGNPTGYTYQWRRCDTTATTCTDITAATNQTYTLTATDLGTTIRLTVTATNTTGATTATSTPTATVAAAPATPNLAPDPDLETSPASSYYGNGAAAFTWATDAARSPTHSLKIVSTTGALTRYMTDTRAIAVTPGATYRVSAWLKTSNVRDAHVSVSYWTGSGAYQGTTVDSPAKVSGTVDWTQLTLTTTAPAGAAFVRVEFRLDGPGTVWIDDIAVTRGG